MPLLNRVRDAAGGVRWTSLRRFRTHLMLTGSAISGLERAYGLEEIVAEGDVASRSIRMSGFSQVRGAWGFHPEFVTIQRDDGGFLGCRRKPAPRPFHPPKDEAELVYLCGLSVWSCMTAPMTLHRADIQMEELGAWTEGGQTWERLKVTAPEGALAFAREAVMYFDRDAMLRRTDFDLTCGGVLPIVAYSSAFQSFSGFTVPTLFRATRRRAKRSVRERTPLLDIEVFDAAYG
jgi:hypothetical protein